MPCVDLVLNVDVFPRPNGSTGVQALSWQGGGKVASGMAAAARLGAQCAMLGGVGSDDYGRFCLRDFERHGIDISGMRVRQGETTSLSVILSDRGTNGRSILYRRGSAQSLSPAELEDEILRHSKWLFISHVTEASMAALARAKEAGAKVIVDGDTFSSELMAKMELIDVFIGSEFFYEVLYRDREYERNCREVCSLGPSITVFTLGDKGCVGFSREEGFCQIPAYQVPVQDTVGAGDVFHGAYTAALLRGLSPEESARLATAVSCIKCTRIGGRAGIPDWPTVQKYLRTGEIDYREIDERVRFYGEKLQL